MQTSSLFIISTFLEYRDLVTAKGTGRSSSGGGAFTGHGLGAAAIGHNGVTNEQRANQADREANIQKTNPEPCELLLTDKYNQPTVDYRRRTETSHGTCFHLHSIL